MKENRTSKVFRKRFRRKNQEKGYSSNVIKISHSYNNLRENLKNENKIRTEIQENIRNMVQNKNKIEEIQEFLNQDKYKAYEQYFEIWVQNWIIKSNLDIKTIINKALKINKNQEEIVEELENANIETYELYKKQIEDYIKNEIETRERKAKKQEEMKKQKEERE